MMKSGHFDAMQWLINEVDDVADLYQLTHSDAEQQVRERLAEGQYCDELSDAQVSRVLAIKAIPSTTE